MLPDLTIKTWKKTLCICKMSNYINIWMAWGKWCQFEKKQRMFLSCVRMPHTSSFILPFNSFSGLNWFKEILETPETMAIPSFLYPRQIHWRASRSCQLNTVSEALATTSLGAKIIKIEVIESYWWILLPWRKPLTLGWIPRKSECCHPGCNSDFTIPYRWRNSETGKYARKSRVNLVKQRFSVFTGCKL